MKTIEPQWESVQR